MRFQENLKKENILSKISEFDIYKKYLKEDLIFGKSISSPFRIDKTPSFCIYLSKSGHIRHKDFGNDHYGDCFEFVKTLFNVSYYEALSIINNDFSLNLSHNYNTTLRSTKKILLGINPGVKVKKNITVDLQPFNFVDIAYWKSYCIEIEILKKFNVNSCKNVYFNNIRSFEYKRNNPIYTYTINKKYKLYFPLEEKGKKWLSNCKYNDIQGLEQINKQGELLIITSSLKDCMVLNGLLNIDTIAPQSESILMEYPLISSLKERFKNIVVWFNNDEPGIKGAEKYKEEYGFKLIYTPIPGIKDPSDMIKNKTKKEGIKLISNLLFEKSSY